MKIFFVSQAKNDKEVFDREDSYECYILDVDGVLTYSNYKNNETANIDIEKVILLRKICDRSSAKVVKVVVLCLFIIFAVCFCHHEFIKVRENYMQKAQSVSICASIVGGS